MRRRTFLSIPASALASGCSGMSRTGQAPPRVLGVIEYGQSNSEGQAMNAAAVLHAVYPEGLRMPRTAAGNVWLGQATVGGRSFASDAVTAAADEPPRGFATSGDHPAPQSGRSDWARKKRKSI